MPADFPGHHPAFLQSAEWIIYAPYLNAIAGSSCCQGCTAVAKVVTCSSKSQEGWIQGVSQLAIVCRAGPLPVKLVGPETWTYACSARRKRPKEQIGRLVQQLDV